MKHLIQNQAARMYFAHGKWTPDIAKAQNFGTPLTAISFSIQNNLKNVDMVLVFGKEPSPANDIRLPSRLGKTTSSEKRFPPAPPQPGRIFLDHRELGLISLASSQRFANHGRLRDFCPATLWSRSARAIVENSG